MKSNKLRVAFSETGDIELTLTLIGNKVDNLALIEKYREILKNDKLLNVEIKQEKHSRTLTQNSYLWVMTNQLANVMRIDKQMCYLQMLGLYGQREEHIISVRSDAVATFYKALQNYCIMVGTRIIEDEVYKDIAILIGSSEYDTRQMAILLDGVISECKEHGIETLTLSEIALMKL
jgi:hypothetical protein